MKFEYVRIEIKVKLPVHDNLMTIISLFQTDNENKHGNLKSRIDVAHIHGYKISNQIQLDPDEFLSEKLFSLPNYQEQNEFNIFSFEWDIKEIIWMMNDRITYQANKFMNNHNQTLARTNQTFDLPFGNDFYLLIHIGVKSDNLDELGDSYEFENEGGCHQAQLKQVLEIEYIKIYANGPNSRVNFSSINDKSQYQIEDVSSRIVYYILAALVILSIIMSSLFVLTYKKLKNQKQINDRANKNGYEVIKQMDDEDYEDFYVDPDYSGPKVIEEKYSSIYDPILYETNQEYLEILSDQ